MNAQQTAAGTPETEAHRLSANLLVLPDSHHWPTVFRLTWSMLLATACAGLLLAIGLLAFLAATDNRLSLLVDEAFHMWLLAALVTVALGLALFAYDRHCALVHARDAERSFRELYNSISEGVFRSTLDGRMISANPALVRLNGYESEEEFIRCCNDIANEWYVDPNRRAEIHQMLLDTGQVTNVVSEVFRHKTRERIWIEECTRLVRDERTGKPLYYDGNVSEVTETMRRLELQDHYDKIASIMSGCLYQHRQRADGTPCMPYASIGLYHIFGVRPEEVVHDTSALRKLIHPEDLDRIAASIDYSRRTLTPWQCEYRVCLPEGVEKSVFAHSVPERESDGATLWHGYIVDVSERKHSEARIYELAYFDALTHLPNRTLLAEHLRQVLSRNGENDRGALLFVDLDHFKVLNDTKGHQVGDRLLCEVAKRIRTSVGPDSLVARIGGDEFIVLLEPDCVDEGANEARAQHVGYHILLAIDQPFVIGENRFQTTASIGAVLFTEGGHDVDDVLKQAELALYEAKAAGRGALRFFREEMQAAAAERLALTSDLRQAQSNGTLSLHYQPIVDAHGRCRRAEALLRWDHPTRGLIPASDFIPLAEHSGFMGSIDQWVLNEACATLKKWEESPRTKDLQLAVNVSAHEVNRMDFADAVERALAARGANPGRLTLELTEHVMLDDIEAVSAVMLRLKALGLHFAIDDFGTGYSSLSYLKRLPIDTLKIDKSFVRDIETDQSDYEIVQMILNIARSLKISVVAEGVENDKQAALLRQIGCQAFQGYLFSKPLPMEAFNAFLETARRDAVEAESAESPGHGRSAM